MSDNTEGGICCPVNGYLEQWLKHAGNVKDSNDWSDSSATGLRRMEAACHALDADYTALLGCSSINRNNSWAFCARRCVKVINAFSLFSVGISVGISKQFQRFRD